MIGNIKVGQLVKSSAGRDKGNYYLIYEMVDEAFVRVIDGEKKRLTNPKMKNIKHLQFLPVIAEELALKILSGEKISEEEVLKAVKSLG